MPSIDLMATKKFFMMHPVATANMLSTITADSAVAIQLHAL